MRGRNQPKKKRLAAPMPCDSDPRKQTVGQRRPTPEVSCKKRFVIRELQMLLSKVSYEEVGLTSEEILMTKELFLRATFVAETDFNYFIWLEPLRAVQDLIWLKLEPGSTRRKDLKTAFWAIGDFGRDMILPPHEYFGLKHQEYREGRARFYWKYDRKRKPPIERYIGVGYKDKGNCRNLSWDGSPSVKEICSSEWFRAELRAEIREKPNYSDMPMGFPVSRESLYSDYPSFTGPQGKQGRLGSDCPIQVSPFPCRITPHPGAVMDLDPDLIKVES